MALVVEFFLAHKILGLNGSCSSRPSCTFLIKRSKSALAYRSDGVNLSEPAQCFR
jgi:hypothetical protein